MKNIILERIKKALGIRSPSAIPSKPTLTEKEEPPRAESRGGAMERTSAPMIYKLGSLFDGSGGFPLAGSLCGIVPVWAAEIEPYPIAVTCSRFPNMRHLGDISKVNGAEIEPVDIITFGSPCQDLSTAGKRAGLKHEANGDEETTRSGLFMEAVRIIKEMREATNGVYPKFALWENVPGAFTSNKGEDFKIVCEELIKIVEPSAVMPAVPKNGWPYADSYCGDGWSLAYRVFDAQYWGVPQRRRRIHLVTDFTGQCARQVCFEREGVRGYFGKSGTPWQAVASDAKGGAGAADREGAVPYTLKIRSGCEGGGKGALVQTDKSATIKTTNDQYLFQPVGVLASSAANAEITDGSISPCLMARAGTGGNQLPLVALAKQSAESEELICQVDSIGGKSEMAGFGKVAPCLKATHYKNPPAITVPAAAFCPEESAKTRGVGYAEEQRPTLRAGVTPAVVYSLQGNTIDRNAKQNGSGICENVSHTINAVDRHGVAFAMQGFGDYKESETASSLKARDYKDATNLVAEVAGVDCRNATEYPEKTGGLQAASAHNINSNNVVRIRYIVRRLTPTECARLQGFADEWGHIGQKESLTPEEHAFWLEVRNTHAAINGKVVKEYTEQQMLAWYNKLHTDSSEYKMWGNGIALPPALYCMQGIKDALVAGK